MKTTSLILAALLILALASALQAAPARGDKSPDWWPGERPGVHGTVDNVSATSIAVKTPKGVRQFVVNDKTRVRVEGEKATIADVKIGDPVGVQFALGANNVAVAQVIVVPRPAFRGKVVSVQGNTINITSRDAGNQVVLVSDQTKIRSNGYTGSMEDIRVGYGVAARGVISGQEIAAEIVEFLPPVAKGTIAAVEGDTVTLKTIRGQSLKFQAVQGAVVHIKPRTGPNKLGTWADVKAGTPANVGFHPVQGGPGALLWIGLLIP